MTTLDWSAPAADAHIAAGQVGAAMSPFYLEIAMDAIFASSTNPRKNFAKDGIAELAESMRTNGLAQPILVRPIESKKGRDYEIVAGERRWRAAQSLLWATIPANVRSLTDLQALELQVIENLHRADLHPLEEAEGYEQLMKKHSYTVDQVAAKIGKSKAYVYGRLKLTALSAKARIAFFDGKLDASCALLVARIPHDKLQEQAVKEMSGRDMTYRDAADYVHRTFMLRLADAPWKLDDATLFPQAGPCTTCPKRTGNQPELFGDVNNADICTDTTCFATKKTKHVTRALAAAKEAGKKVLQGAEAKKVFPYDYSTQPYGGYAAATGTDYNDPKRRTYKELASIAKVEPTLVLQPKTGDLVEVFDEKKIKAGLKAAGEVAPRSSSGSGDSDREKQRAAKIESAYRLKLFDKVFENAVGKLTGTDWRMIAAWALQQLPHDDYQRLAKVREWDDKFDRRTSSDQQVAFLNDLSDGDVAMLIFDCSLIAQTHKAAWSADKAPELHAAAERHGVDAKALKKAVQDEMALKPKKAKPAGKSVVAKYKSPTTGETWSGRGKQPKWIEVALSRGTKLEELLA